MNRKEFIKGSAILGVSIAMPSFLYGQSGMYSGKGNRKIYRILNADRVNVGTLPVMRAFAGDNLDHVSPFVLFDEFGPVDVRPGADALRVDAVLYGLHDLFRRVFARFEVGVRHTRHRRVIVSLTPAVAARLHT